MINRFVYGFVLGALLSVGVAGSAFATTITYSAVDLGDTAIDEDLWQYRYSVTGSFVPFGGFNVLFTPALYKLLEDPPTAVHPNWFTSVTEPDLGLGADGLYTATALVFNPSLADQLLVSFVWLGSGTPGSQPFEVFDDTFALTESGRTQVPAVNGAPIPDTLALCAVGLLLFAAQRRRRYAAGPYQIPEKLS